MCLLHLAETSRASVHLDRPLSCAYTGTITHIQLRAPPTPRPSEVARSPDVLRTSSHGSLIPCLILHAPVALSSSDVSQILGGCCPSPRWGPHGLPHAAVPLSSKRCSRIQTSSPHRVWPLRIQVCAPFTYGQFSKVSPMFICGPHLPRCTARPSCGPLLPRPAIILPQIRVLALDVARCR